MITIKVVLNDSEIYQTNGNGIVKLKNRIVRTVKAKKIKDAHIWCRVRYSQTKVKTNEGSMAYIDNEFEREDYKKFCEALRLFTSKDEVEHALNYWGLTK